MQDGADLDSEMLSDIFDRIQKNQISLKEDDMARKKEEEKTSSGAGGSMFGADQLSELDTRRREEFTKQRDSMVRTTEHYLKQRRSARADKAGHGAFVRTGDEGTRKDEYVPSMFSVTWAACLSAFR